MHFLCTYMTCLGNSWGTVKNSNLFYFFVCFCIGRRKEWKEFEGEKETTNAVFMNENVNSKKGFSNTSFYNKFHYKWWYRQLEALPHCITSCWVNEQQIMMDIEYITPLLCLLTYVFIISNEIKRIWLELSAVLRDSHYTRCWMCIFIFSFKMHSALL